MTRPPSMSDALAQAWDEGAQAGWDAAGDSYPLAKLTNPYRTPADEHRHEWHTDTHGLSCDCGAHQGATPIDPERLRRNRL